MCSNNPEFRSMVLQYLGLRGCGKKFRAITAKFIRLEKRKQVVKIETSLKHCRNAEEAKEDIREEESTLPQIDISMVEESRRHHEFTTVPADGIVNPVRTPPIQKHKNCTIASFTEVLSRDPVVFPDEDTDNEDLDWESSSVMQQRFVVDATALHQENQPTCIWEMKTTFLKKYVPYKNKRRWYIGSNCYLGWAGDKTMKLQPVTCKFVRRENYKTIVKIVNPANIESSSSISATGQAQDLMQGSSTPTVDCKGRQLMSAVKVNGQLGEQCCVGLESHAGKPNPGREWIQDTTVTKAIENRPFIPSHLQAPTMPIVGSIIPILAHPLDLSSNTRSRHDPFSHTCPSPDLPLDLSKTLCPRLDIPLDLSSTKR
ncbi:uncharacterized protein LOC144926881 isoform X2 [Branchiostoma floridae x Branchiostoma belcheri]